jgi:tripartite-type tricarboxylate transporter receptor subunit TctC
MRFFIAAFALALCLAIPPAVHAQSFPSRVIRLVIIVPPANAADIIARLFAPHMAEQFKQNIVVDNRAGAGGIIATNIVKNAPADGHTLLVTSSAHAINPTLYSKLPYDAVKDFSFIGMSGSAANVLVVNPQLPVNSVNELIALAKSRRDEIIFGSSGSGTTVHLSAVLFSMMAGIKATHVPYKGASEALNDLISGQLQFMTASMSSAIQLVRSGKLRALAVTSAQRHQALPDLPTIAETIPGYEAIVWFGVLGPAGVPKPVVDTLNRALNEAFRAPEVSTKLAAVGVDLVTSTPEEFAAYVRAEIPKWGKVVKASGARAD